MASNALRKLSGRLGLSCRLSHVCQKSISRDALGRVVQKSHVHSNAPLLATIKIDMPSLSPTMEKGNLIKWLKKEGDTISPGDVLCEIETDKAVISMDTEEEGTLAKILIPDNTKDITVGQLIALMVEEGEDWQNVEIPVEAAAPASSATSGATASTSPVPASAPAPVQEHGHLMGPSVKKLLQEYNLQASAIPVTGPAGTLLKGDVLNYIKTKSVIKADMTIAAPSSPPPPPAAVVAPTPVPTPAAGANYVDIPLSNMRRTIAKRLTESKSTIPHAYASIDSNVGPMTELRKLLKADGVKLSANDFVIKASAMALQRVPRVNAIWAGDGPQLSSTVDIAIAVATPNGLITPIVRGATHLTVDQISDTVKELAGRAKEGKLQLHEFQGGSFSISNLGMFGITEFTAVINPPQLAIMAVGTSRSVAQMDGEGLYMTVTLSYDSRALDPLDATRFLEEFRAALENPQSLLAGTHLDSEAEAFAF